MGVIQGWDHLCLPGEGRSTISQFIQKGCLGSAGQAGYGQVEILLNGGTGSGDFSSPFQH